MENKDISTDVNYEEEPEFRELKDVEPGQWYWIKEDDKEDEQYPEWFACVTHIGSNYVKLIAPHKCNSQSYERIHFDDFFKKCRYEPNHEQVIKDSYLRIRYQLKEKMQEVKLLTQRLCLEQVESLQDGPSKNALVAVSSNNKQIADYKKDLIKAQDNLLPELFEEIKELNEEYAFWLNAEVVPLEAMSEKMKGILGVVKDRVFHVELYAGLTEEIHHVREGETAGMDDRLHLMQRRCYMDEECLIDYEHGGMNYENIEQFDEWLSKKKNMERILPFPKCIIAFRVRREEKDYENTNMFIRIMLENADTTTFLYIRNGDNLYRLNTGLDFGEKLFPEITEFDSKEKLWVEMWGSKIHGMMPDREYQDRIKEEKKNRRLAKQWRKKNPKKSWMDNPYESMSHDFNYESYDPFDSTNVYYDDIKKDIEDKMKQYNRIVLVVQGLFDRSPVLHPHPVVKMWDRESFESAIKLVYDADNVLTTGIPPDFEAYRDRLNETIKTGTIVIGQEDYWERIEAQRINDRLNNRRSYRNDRHYNYKRYRPDGNPGPGFVTKVQRFMPRVKKCVFRWERKSTSWYYTAKDKIPCTLKVPCSELLNVEEYILGDYHQFFDDPRTRQDYLKWAPFLLLAEDLKSGKIKENEHFTNKLKTLRKRG